MLLKRNALLMVGITMFIFMNCQNNKRNLTIDSSPPIIAIDTIIFSIEKEKIPTQLFSAPLEKDITIGTYFSFMDSLVVQYDTSLAYSLNEHLIVRANPWIIDTLENTGYYRMMERDSFVYNQKNLIVLKKGDSLLIPDEQLVTELLDKQSKTIIDVNIPEFRLRIIEDGKILYTFPVRVGRDERKFLAMAGREVSLRTATGKGKIVRIARDPVFINPSDGKRFTHTRRDDKRLTLMPLIPWIEPELDGHRYGHLIHPTTNPSTLEKAYSNGCVGTKESDAWRIYYYAPVGTQVVFRYDLYVVNKNGDTVRLKDIYHKDRFLQ